jgi:hypothetical protein
MCNFLMLNPTSKEEGLGCRMEALVADVACGLAERIRPRPEAIILTGSFARREESALIVANRLRLLSDMEFMVVFPPGENRLRLQEDLNAQSEEMAKGLARGGVECELEFRAVTPQYFTRLKPHIFGHELVSCGRTVWGKGEILASAPRISAAAIPLWDAWRMLNNRLLEQLQWVEALQSGDRVILMKALYHLLKTYLDIGTAALIFARRYESTYAGRAAALLTWAAENNRKSHESFIEGISRRVLECTAFKLSPDVAKAPLGVSLNCNDIEEFRGYIRKAALELLPLARTIWRWQASRIGHVAAESQVEDSFLQDAVLRTQGLSERVQAWGKLFFIPEIRRQPDLLRRMCRLVWRGSPRYLTYRVASTLYFQLANLLAGLEVDHEATKLEVYLPILFADCACERRPWWRIRDITLRGWRLFLRNHWH